MWDVTCICECVGLSVCLEGHHLCLAKHILHQMKLNYTLQVPELPLRGHSMGSGFHLGRHAHGQGPWVAAMRWAAREHTQDSAQAATLRPP